MPGTSFAPSESSDNRDGGCTGSRSLLLLFKNYSDDHVLSTNDDCLLGMLKHELAPSQGTDEINLKIQETDPIIKDH